MGYYMDTGLYQACVRLVSGLYQAGASLALLLRFAAPPALLYNREYFLY